MNRRKFFAAPLCLLPPHGAELVRAVRAETDGIEDNPVLAAAIAGIERADKLLNAA